MGEFVDAQERNYDETIKLIEDFLWNDQRDKIVIDLTNPSITIEGKNNDFLKAALFFKQKYVLYYFDESNVLFTKSLIKLKDGYEYIKNFFEQPKFYTSNLKKETIWLQHNLKHFVTHDFQYVLTANSTRKYLLSTSGISFAFSIFIISLLIVKGTKHLNGGAMFFIFVIMLLIGGGLNLFLFFNYYIYAKGKVLIMSKGNDTFYYGDSNSPTRYHKKDIVQFITKRWRGYISPIHGFVLITIEFEDGTDIRIPNILIDRKDLEWKLFEYNKVEKGGFPFLRP